MRLDVEARGASGSGGASFSSSFAASSSSSSSSTRASSSLGSLVACRSLVAFFALELGAGDVSTVGLTLLP